MTPAARLFSALTQEEWKTVFSVCFLAGSDDYGSSFDLKAYASPNYPAGPTSWDEDFRRAIRFLALELGMGFDGIRATDTGSIMAPEEPICAGNALYAQMLAVGGLPDLPEALRTAIRVLGERAPHYDASPLREALSDVFGAVVAMPPVDPEELDELFTQRDEALRALGVVRSNGDVN